MMLKKRKNRKNKITDIICSIDRFQIINTDFNRKTGQYKIEYKEPSNDEILLIYGSKQYLETLYSHSGRKLIN